MVLLRDCENFAYGSFAALILTHAAAAAFATVYLFTAELFPTVARNQAVGVCALTAKLGGATTMLLDMLGVGCILILTSV